MVLSHQHIPEEDTAETLLRRLKSFDKYPQYLTNCCTIERILTSCITVWYENSTALYRKALQREVRTAQHIPGGNIQAIQDIHVRRCQRRLQNIAKGSTLHAYV